MKKYNATWESLDSRPVPQWYRDAKIGVFLHWGIYSVPAYAPRRNEVDFPDKAYAEWYAYYVQNKDMPHYKFHKSAYPANVTYRDLAAQWNPVFFNADEWMKLFKYAGAKYFIPTAKHHDGFCLYNSEYSHNWNSVEIGPKRDIITELMQACDKHGITRGIYYSLLEWFHPVMQNCEKGKGDVRRYAGEKMLPQLKELVNRFDPQIIFSDGSWDYHSDEWMSKDFLAWLYNESKVADTVIVNDRWGSDTIAEHGGYFTSEYEFINSQAKTEEEAREVFKKHIFSEGRSIGYSFGFNRNEKLNDYLTESELINLLVDVITRGGNFLLNVGPCADGTISPIIEERLVQMGDWIKINGEAIYSTNPLKLENAPPQIKATANKDSIYLFFNRYPKAEVKLAGTCFGGKSKIELLGIDRKVEGKITDTGIEFSAPVLTVDELPSRCVYVFKIS